ncbi:MAG: hypothetical protein WCK37_00375 [Candidatus Falkowbacteria bacterium]
MFKSKPGYLMLILLLSVTIIAIIIVAGGNFTQMFGSKKSAGTVNYQVDDMQKKVDAYNQNQKNALSE